MQAWLSFCGFVDEAAQQRRNFFSSDRFYNRVNRIRVVKHGYDYDFKWSSQEIDEDARPDAPPVAALLISYLCYQIAHTITPSTADHRKACIRKFGLSGKTREEQDAELINEPYWLAGLIKSAAPLLFAELCGFVLLRALGADFYDQAGKILRKTDMQPIFERLDFSQQQKATEDDAPSPTQTQIYAQLWCLFCDQVDRLAEDQAWKSSFLSQSSRPRFMYAPETRRRLLRGVEQLDRTCKTRKASFVWSEHFDASKGIFKGVADAIKRL